MMQLSLRLLKHLRDFSIRRLWPEAGPYRLWVDITSRCNLACPACAQRLLPAAERRDMPEALLDTLTAQVSGMAINEVNLFHRGEPFLHPEFSDWVGRFKQAGAMVRVHTNATLLDREKVDAILQAGPQIVTCSIDHLDSTGYADSRRGAVLADTMLGLEMLLTQRKLRGLKQPKVNLLLMGRQNESLEKDARLIALKSLGIDRVVWRKPHNWAGAVGPADDSRKIHTCTFPWYGLAVLSDGRVSPCPQDFFGQMVLGRADEKPLWDIWQGKAARDLRKAHARLDLTDYPVCRACDRIRRKTMLGLPLEHLHNFITEVYQGGRL
jgi:radical SAM protein with 4Fe4S-binding SPASM domain